MGPSTVSQKRIVLYTIAHLVHSLLHSQLKLVSNHYTNKGPHPAHDLGPILHTGKSMLFTCFDKISEHDSVDILH